MPGSSTIQTHETPKHTLPTPLCLSGHKMWESHPFWLHEMTQEWVGEWLGAPLASPVLSLLLC